MHWATLCLWVKALSYLVVLVPVKLQQNEKNNDDEHLSHLKCCRIVQCSVTELTDNLHGYSSYLTCVYTALRQRNSRYIQAILYQMPAPRWNIHPFTVNSVAM